MSKFSFQSNYSITNIYNSQFKNFVFVWVHFQVFTIQSSSLSFTFIQRGELGGWCWDKETLYLGQWAWVKQNDGLITSILFSLTIATKSLIDNFRQVSTLDACVRNDYVYAGLIRININIYDSQMRCSHSLESLPTGFCTIHHRIQSINQHRNESSAALWYIISV